MTEESKETTDHNTQEQHDKPKEEQREQRQTKTSQDSITQSAKPRQQNVRSVKGYLVFLEEHLGKGQYGQVCRAKLATEAKKKDAKIFACKIMEVANIA